MASLCHGFSSQSSANIVFRMARYVLLSLAMFTFVSTHASAFFVDLHLDVDFDGGDPSNGGTWRLAAMTGGQGLFALGVGISDIDAAVDFHVPSGTVNGTDAAGFSTILNTTISGGRQLFVGQQTLPNTVSEQGVFYGVGTLNNGAPNSSASPFGTNSIGPEISSLSGLTNVAWASGHQSTSFDVASGTFSAGDSPFFDFGFDGVDQALILDTTPATSSEVGQIEEAFIFYSAYTTNLGVTIEQGDFNGDDIVDASDYTLWLDTLGQTVFPGTGADASGNGLIDQSDYNLWASNYGTTASSSSFSGASAVPEPSGAAIALLGLLIGSMSSRTEKSN